MYNKVKGVDHPCCSGCIYAASAALPFSRFMIAAGRILREVNGLVMDPNKSVWYYLANGQVADYTGLVQFDGAWFYVISGRLATEYSGQMEYDGEWFTVLNGQVV